MQALITAVVLLIALGMFGRLPSPMGVGRRSHVRPRLLSRPEIGRVGERSSTRCASRLAWRSEYTR